MSDAHPLRLKYLLSLIFLLFTCPAQGQTDIEPARKFDEFGDVDASDIIARLDSLAIALQNEPHARAYFEQAARDVAAEFFTSDDETTT